LVALAKARPLAKTDVLDEAPAPSRIGSFDQRIAQPAIRSTDNRHQDGGADRAHVDSCRGLQFVDGAFEGDTLFLYP
jgi:hypothetical protein